MKKNISVKLQIQITTAFLLIIIISSFFIISFTYSRTHSSILHLSRSAIKRTTELLEEHVRCLTQKSQELPLILSGSINNISEISVKNSFLMTYLKNLILNYDDFDAFYVASTNGDFLSYFRRLGRDQMNYVLSPEKPLPLSTVYAFHEVITNPSNRFEKFSYFDRDFKEVGQESTTDLGFNPKRRPWYSSSLKKGEVYWINEYPDADTDFIVTTFVAGIFDPSGTQIGVAAVDLSLKSIDDFMSKLNISKRGHSAIINEKNGHIIIPINQQDLENTAVSPAIIHKAHSLYISSNDENFLFTENGVEYLVGFNQINLDSKNHWLVVVIAPLLDFVGGLIEAENKLIAISILAVILASITVLFFSKKISTPISILAKELDRIQNLDLETREKIKSNIYEINILQRSIQSLKQGIRTFSRYVPKEVVKDLIHLGQDISLGGEKRDITIMFTDIAGFTNLSEKLPADQIMNDLCSYFDDLSKVIISKMGTIDKFIGDSIMVLWGATVKVPKSWNLACEAALECQIQVQKINELRHRANLPPFITKIGIDSGSAIVGNIGTDERMNFTAIGDVINSASRLQSVSPIFHSPIIVSDAVYQHVVSEFILRPLGEVGVKGKKNKITIYELMGKRTEGEPISASPQIKHLADSYTSAVELLDAGQYLEAFNALSHLSNEFPDDEPLKLMKQKAKELLNQKNS